MFLKDYVVIDNVLENPDKYIQLAKSTGYEYNTKFPCTLEKINIELTLPLTNEFNWRGFRSKELHMLDQDLFSATFNTIFKKLYSNLGDIQFNYHVSSYLHYNSKDIGNCKEWWHIDKPYLYAGVIYLNKNPPKDTGTLILLQDNTTVTIENVFNRLIFYNSNLLHRPQACFGSSIDDARLTVVFFIKNIAVGKP